MVLNYNNLNSLLKSQKLLKIRVWEKGLKKMFIHKARSYSGG